jgi:hypothetical protein
MSMLQPGFPVSSSPATRGLLSSFNHDATATARSLPQEDDNDAPGFHLKLVRLCPLARP